MFTNATEYKASPAEARERDKNTLNVREQTKEHVCTCHRVIFVNSVGKF